MNITKKLAKETKQFMKDALRVHNVVDKQITTKDITFPYIYFDVDKDIDFKVDFSKEDVMIDRMKVDNPKIVAYTLVDHDFTKLYEKNEYDEMDNDEFVDEMVLLIQRKLIARPDADEIIKEKRKESREK